MTYNPSYDYNSIKSVVPYYSGGGIYVFGGKLNDGKGFMATDDNFVVLILDKCPDLDVEETWEYEWQEEHTLYKLEENDNHRFMIDMLSWFLENGRSGCGYESDAQFKASNAYRDAEMTKARLLEVCSSEASTTHNLG